MKIKQLAGSSHWVSGLATLAAIALLCGLLVYWAMTLLAPAVAIAPSGSLVNQTVVDTSAADNLFGSPDRTQAEASEPLPRNIQVVGVAASSFRAVAIITVDNQPAAPFAVGQKIDDRLSVRSVSAREVVLDNDGELIRVPTPAGASLAVLTSNADAGTQGDGAGTTNAFSAAGAVQPNRPADPQEGGFGNRSAPPGGFSPPAAPTSANLAPLPPRRLPPAGADAAAAAAENTSIGTTAIGDPGTNGQGQNAGSAPPGSNQAPPFNPGQGRPDGGNGGPVPGQQGPGSSPDSGNVRSALDRALRRLDGQGNPMPAQ